MIYDIITVKTITLFKKSNAKKKITFIFGKILATHSIAQYHVSHGQHASPIHQIKNCVEYCIVCLSIWQ